MRHFEFVHTFMKESFGRTYGKRLVGSFAKGTKQDSEPATSVRGSQPIEPNASHLRETLVIGVQVIAQISRRVKSAHIHNADFLPSISALSNNTWNKHVSHGNVTLAHTFSRSLGHTLNLRVE